MAGKHAKDWYSKKLDMPIDEIVSEYRQARDKNKQIDILADLCGTKSCRIAWILSKCGLAVDVVKLPRAQRNPAMPDYVAHWENSEDAMICDRLKKQIQEAQTMPGFEEIPTDDEKEKEVMVKPFEKEEDIIKRLEETEEAEKEAVVSCPAELGWEEPLTGTDLRRGILTDAAACVCTDRNLQYGEPEDNFSVIATMWAAYLGFPVSAVDVGNLMILFKVGRLATAEKPSRDSYVDIAGYAACAGGMIE